MGWWVRQGVSGLQPSVRRPCHACAGTGQLEDVTEGRAQVCGPGQRGAGRCQLCTPPPSPRPGDIFIAPALQICLPGLPIQDLLSQKAKPTLSNFHL